MLESDPDYRAFPQSTSWLSDRNLVGTLLWEVGWELSAEPSGRSAGGQHGTIFTRTCSGVRVSSPSSPLCVLIRSGGWQWGRHSPGRILGGCGCGCGRVSSSSSPFCLLIFSEGGQHGMMFTRTCSRVWVSSPSSPLCVLIRLGVWQRDTIVTRTLRGVPVSSPACVLILSGGVNIDGWHSPGRVMGCVCHHYHQRGMTLTWTCSGVWMSSSSPPCMLILSGGAKRGSTLTRTCSGVSESNPNTNMLTCEETLQSNFFSAYLPTPFQHEDMWVVSLYRQQEKTTLYSNAILAVISPSRLSTMTCKLYPFRSSWRKRRYIAVPVLAPVFSPPVHPRIGQFWFFACSVQKMKLYLHQELL